jgi:NDP-sugar pyrophosphorylase family protein
MKTPIQLVIPAAGAGSRFREVGIRTPKPLIPISGIPMIIWVIANFSLCKEDKLIIVCQESDNLKEHLEKFLNLVPCKIEYVEINDLTDGPATTVSLAASNLDLDKPVIVANSDQYVSEGLAEFIDSVRCSKYVGTILTMEASGNKWSYVGRDSKGKINEVVEKQEISSEATVGIYAWSSANKMMDGIAYLKSINLRVNNEFYLGPTYGYLIKNNLSVGTVSVGTHGAAVHGLGTPDDLDQFLNHMDFEIFRKQVSRYT